MEGNQQQEQPNTGGEYDVLNDGGEELDYEGDDLIELEVTGE